jgi:hypothetical protein
VTIASRPSLGRDGAGYNFDLGQARTELFFQMGVDRANHVDPLQQNSLLVKTPLCGQDGGEAGFADGINVRCTIPAAPAVLALRHARFYVLAA